MSRLRDSFSSVVVIDCLARAIKAALDKYYEFYGLKYYEGYRHVFSLFKSDMPHQVIIEYQDSETLLIVAPSSETSARSYLSINPCVRTQGLSLFFPQDFSESYISNDSALKVSLNILSCLAPQLKKAQKNKDYLPISAHILAALIIDPNVDLKLLIKKLELALRESYTLPEPQRLMLQGGSSVKESDRVSSKSAYPASVDNRSTATSSHVSSVAGGAVSSGGGVCDGGGGSACAPEFR